MNACPRFRKRWGGLGQQGEPQPKARRADMKITVSGANGGASLTPQN
jgi:hypothetical protein